MKTATAPLPPLRSVKVLDQLRERIRYLHYSLRTEQAYVNWVRAFIRFHGVRPCMGKYYTQGDKVLMPLAIQVHHAVCDGFHVGRMLNELQQFLCMRPIRKPPLPARWPIH